MVAAVVVASFADASACRYELGKDYPEPAVEQAAFETMRGVVNALQEKEHQSGETYRFFHAKTHACARGKLTVAENIPSDLRQGMFSQPGKVYDVVTRFSNGLSDIKPDSAADTRGHAMQVLNVEGERLLPGDRTSVQTWIGAAFPTFLFSEAKVIAEQMEIFSRTGPLGAAAKAAFLAKHPLTAIAVAKTLLAGKDITNPLDAKYWSQTPYKWGEGLAIKYKFEPCLGQALPDLGKSGSNYLREALVETLNTAEIAACYNMYVQRQEDACKQPVEDAMVEWDTPFTRVATIIYETDQDLVSPAALNNCENAEFNPWHGITEHQPLGINRIRKLIYPFSSGNRHSLNAQSVYDF